MKVLVTGGAGYLGSILTRKLLEKNYQVRVMDKMWYGEEPLRECEKDSNFELVREDIRNLVLVAKSLKEVDAVIHLASIVGMPASRIEPRTSEEINYFATKNIAELCELHGIPTYVFASTCSVYGSQKNTLVTEKSRFKPIELDFYAQQKFKSERAIGWLNSAPTILRFGTLFGLSPRMRFDLVINLFIAQSITEGKITVEGGNQYRPFLHVADAADSLIFSLENNLTGFYNVLYENFTILEIAKKIQKLSGCEIKIEEKQEDKRDYKVSAEKIKKMGFKPKYNIEQAYDEIKNAIESGKIKNYSEVFYNNYKLLFSSKEKQKEVFVQGI